MGRLATRAGNRRDGVVFGFLRGDIRHRTVPRESRCRPKPPNERAMTSKPLLCGVELGGTKCECLVGTAPDDIRERITLKTESDAAATLRRIEGILRDWRGPHRALRRNRPARLGPRAV